MFGDSSGRSTAGAQAPRLFLDQNEARRTEKSFFEAAPPPPLSEGLDALLISKT